jgi:hypothetical protein
MRASAVAGALLAAALLIACAPAAGASAVQKNKKDVDFYEGGSRLARAASLRSDHALRVAEGRPISLPVQRFPVR